MATISHPDGPIFQEFKDEHGKMQCSLPAQTDESTGERYVLWSDILCAFEDIDHVEDHFIKWRVRRVFFMVNESYQV